MDVKKINLHHNDPPWIIENFKRETKRRQQAFSLVDTTTIKLYRNKINRGKDAVQITTLLKLAPSKSDSLISQLQIENLDKISEFHIAYLIKDSFQESMTKYDHLSDYDLQILMESSEDVPPVGMNITSSSLCTKN